MNYDELEAMLRAWSPDLPTAERIPVLQGMVRYWWGEAPVHRQPVSASLSLPAPLNWLYSEVLSRSPGAGNRASWIAAEPMLYNSLRNPDELEVDASGISPFLIEQQGVYRCGTRVEDDDGPVFRQDYGASDWRPCASRLSDFLLWALVYELMVCRELTVWGYFTPDHAAKVTAEMTRVAMGGVSTYGIESDIYHADEIAIFWSENKPTEICLEGIARSAAGFARLTTLGEWSDE